MTRKPLTHDEKVEALFGCSIVILAILWSILKTFLQALFFFYIYSQILLPAYPTLPVLGFFPILGLTVLFSYVIFR